MPQSVKQRKVWLWIGAYVFWAASFAARMYFSNWREHPGSVLLFFGLFAAGATLAYYADKAG